MLACFNKWCWYSCLEGGQSTTLDYKNVYVVGGLSIKKKKTITFKEYRYNLAMREIFKI